MAKKDLRKLKRIELLDLMIEQGKQLEEQLERNKELEERLQKLELQQQASEDRIGHLKTQVEQATVTNQTLRSQAQAAKRESARASENAASLRKENAVLTAKLDEALSQVRNQSENVQLKGLASSEREALSALAQRMENAIERSQAADKERTARLDAILENQQEILNGISTQMEPVVVERHAAPAPVVPASYHVEKPESPISPLRLVPQLGKKKKKKKKEKDR